MIFNNFTELVLIIVIVPWCLDGKKKTQDSKSTKYLQKIEHTGTQTLNTSCV